MKRMNRMLAFITAMLILFSSVMSDGGIVYAAEDTVPSETVEVTDGLPTEDETDELQQEEPVAETPAQEETPTQEETQQETVENNESTENETAISEEESVDEELEAEEEQDEQEIVTGEESKKIQSFKLLDALNFDKAELNKITTEVSGCNGIYDGLYYSEEEFTAVVVHISFYDEEGKQLASNSTGSIDSFNREMSNGVNPTVSYLKAEDLTFDIVKKDSNGNYVTVSDEETPVYCYKVAGYTGADANGLRCLVDGKRIVTESEGYYFRVRLAETEYCKACEKVIPLVVNKNDYVSAVKPTIFCESEEEAYQAVRDIIVNRTNNIDRYGAENYRKYSANGKDGKEGYVYERIAVNSDVVNEITDNTLTLKLQTIPINEVTDFCEEREGMKPWEGDYIRNYIGDSKKASFYYEDPCFFTKVKDQEKELGTFYHNGQDYYIYEVYIPVMTTAAQEKAVTDKVNSLKTTTFAGYENWSTEKKIKAVYDYVTSHVSGNVGSDRSNPKYHTAYSALIDGKGTCEAYAQAFTRLSRELGVPSRVIMGVDSGAHTYNIVQVSATEDKWMYIDCSAHIYLTGTSFKRAQEQARFRNPKFVANYLNKIGKVAAIISVEYGETCKTFSTWSSAITYINTLEKNGENVCKISLAGNVSAVEGFGAITNSIPIEIVSDSSTVRTITYTGNIALSTNTAFKNITLVAGKNADTSIDVNGHSMTISDGGDWSKLSVKDSSTGGIFATANADFKIKSVTVDNVYIGADNTLKVISDANINKLGAIADESGEGSATIAKYVNTKLAINSVAPLSSFSIKFETLNAKDVLIDTPLESVLFNTTNVELGETTSGIEIVQPTNSTVSSDYYYDDVVGGIIVGKCIIELSSPEAYISMSKFASWTGVVNYINKLNQKNATYTITVLENIDEKKLVFPNAKKTAGITVKGKTPSVEIKHGADLAATCNVTFENISLASDNTKAKLNTAGYQVTFKNVNIQNTYASIANSGKGTLRFVDCGNIKSTGAISVVNLDVENCQIISENGGIAVTGTANLESATIDVKTTVTIKNIESLDANNSISYGTDYKNKISITGTVNAKTSSVELNAKNTIGDKTHQVKISQYAINLLPKYLTENNYEKAADYENKAIVSGKQIPACYFVVGRTTSGSDVTVAFTTKKVGNALQLDFDPAIRPVEVFEGAESAKCSWGTYATLKEAFAEIDKSGSASKNYIIVIDTVMDGSDASTSIKENVTTASKANQITIRPADETKKYQLLTKNAITLKTNLVLKNVVIGDNKNNKGVNTKLDINLGNFKLFMSDVTTSEDRIRNVKGSNVNGTSAIVINNSGFDTDCPMNFFVWGNIDKVGTLKFSNPAVTVLGKTNIGNLEYTGSDFGTFIGTSSVSTKKVDGSLVATKVTSNISVANKIISSKKTVEGVDVPALGICLMYKDKEQGYVTVGGDDATYSGYADNVLVHNKPFYQIVKAPKAANNSFMYVDDKQPDALTCKKNGSIYLVDENTLKENYGLYEIDNLDDTSNRVELATFATLKEAIDEINTRKDSKAYYLVAPLVETPAPEKLIVPKAKCAAGLVFGNVSPTAELSVFTYTNDNLKLTCDTVFKDFAVYCDDKAMNFEIYDYTLKFSGKCNWNSEPQKYRYICVGSIKGSGEGKNSNVYLEDIEEFSAIYDITKVGTLTLDNSNVVCFKKVSLGRIDQIDGTNEFRTSVNYKQKRNSYIVTSATTNATIINGINREGGILYFGQCAHDYYFKEDYVEDIYEHQEEIDCSDIIGGTTLAMPLFKTTNGVMADEDGKPTFYYRCGDNSISSIDNKILKKDGTVYYNTNSSKSADNFVLTDDTGKTYGTYCKYSDAVNEINNILPKANYTLTVSLVENLPEGIYEDSFVDTYSIPKVSKAPVFTVRSESLSSLYYDGSKQLVLKLGANQKVYFENIYICFTGNCAKPCKIQEGKNSELKIINGGIF